MTRLEFVAEVEKQMELFEIPKDAEVDRIDLTEVDLQSRHFTVWGSKTGYYGIRIIG